MKFIKYIAIIVLVFSALSVPAQTEKGKGNSSKPNIIYILADDLGINGVSSYGADRYKTPNIDNLAKTGMQFNRAYTAPLCGPSRALILTGRYAFRTGATNQDATGEMSPSVETMTPKVLKAAGYVTSSIGKWGQLPLGPADFGFDDYLKFKGSGVYWNDEKKSENYIENGETKPLHDKEYMPDVLHNHLVDFINKNKDKLFYIYYSMSGVHAQITRTPDSKPDSKDLYADNIVYMDKLVGKLIAELDRLKLRENTLIVFMGDNGTAGKYAAEGTVHGKQIIGKKGEMEEGGSQVPFIANWTGKIAPGKVTDQLIDASDLMPTFTELAGASLPTKNVLDGKSFLPQLLGQKGSPRDWVFMELGNKWWVRDANWKLNQAGQLFDMSNAPYEEKPVAADTKEANATAERAKLQAVLSKLNPAGGIVDTGDGTGRSSNKAEMKPVEKNDKKEKKNKKDKPEN